MIKGATQHEDNSNSKHVFNRQQRCKTYQTKSDKTERKNREAEALYSPISATDRTGQKIS